MSKGRRLTIDLSPAAVEQLDRMLAETHETTAHLFRYGFALLQIYVQAKQEGQEMTLVNRDEPDVVTRVVLPITVKRKERTR